MNQLLVTALPPLRSPTTMDGAREDTTTVEVTRSLRALRRHIVRSLTIRVDQAKGTPIVLDGSDPRDRLTAAPAHARRAGFEFTAPPVDDGWRSGPDARFYLAYAFAALHPREASRSTRLRTEST